VQSGGTFSNWPLNLPPAGSQASTTLNVPYRFLGVTEELSWLAQFAGQGYEDISALNLPGAQHGDMLVRTLLYR